MPDRPILIFPNPTVASRNDLPPGRPSFRPPAHERQAERIGPKLQRLQNALAAKRVALQGDAAGINPEQVLVLETIGPVDGFMAAVSRISGLEWLVESEGPELQPDYGFSALKDADRLLTGHLFLVASDLQALEQIRNLFRLWQNDPTIKFDHGLNSLKQVFAHLYDIRPWDYRDRIRETGLLDDWKLRLQRGDEVVPFEAELWFRNSAEKQELATADVRRAIGDLGGRIAQNCLIEEVRYHGILGEIPANALGEIANLADIELLRCEGIMYARPVGQCAVRTSEEEATELIEFDPEPREPTGDPIIAMLDGMPLSQHRLLAGRLIIDDPDGYENNYQATQRQHGTSIASLICHGDLNEQDRALGSPVYVRPILTPRAAFDGDQIEQIPESTLPVDLIYRAVRRMFEAEGEEAPVAPSIRIVNLSIGDAARPFFRDMSPWARLLDWLSAKYNIIFVVSSGNYSTDVELSTPREGFRNLPAAEIEEHFLRSITEDTRNRKILSPAESINSITVGAIHDDACPAALPATLTNPLQIPNLPATYNAHGPGFRRSIKPDILLPGGRQLYQERIGTHANARLTPVHSHLAPGQLVATPGAAGELDRTHYVIGTSNAAATASRWGASLFEVLDELRAEHEADLPTEYDTVLVKTLMAHGAEWADARAIFERVCTTGIAANQRSEFIGRFLGYGLSDIGKAATCTEQLVTVLGFGRMTDGQGHEFRFPLPPCLSATAQKRRLTITLGWLSPVVASRQKYRHVRLWFDPRNALVSERVNADYRSVKRGTLQHEVLEGNQVLDFQDGDDIVVKINCREDAMRFTDSVRYGLAVTLEVEEGVELPIYQEVKERLAVRIPIVQ